MVRSGTLSQPKRGEEPEKAGLVLWPTEVEGSRKRSFCTAGKKMKEAVRDLASFVHRA